MYKLIYGAVAALALITGTQSLNVQHSEASLTQPQFHSSEAKLSIQQPIKKPPLTLYHSRYKNEVFLIDSVRSGQKKEGVALSFHTKLIQSKGVYRTTLSKNAMAVLKTGKDTFKQPLRSWINPSHPESTDSILFKGALGKPTWLSLTGILVTDSKGNPPAGYVTTTVPVTLEFHEGCAYCEMKNGKINSK